MRAYEIMIIIDADVDDSGIHRVLTDVNERVEAEGGKVVATDRWGRRRFAYQINRKSEGYYVVLEVVTEATNLDNIDRALRLADETVRHKIIRLPEREAIKRGLLTADASPARSAG